MSAPPLHMPVRIAGRYLVQNELGIGGAGAVYRVRDEVNGQLVALKQLLSPAARKRAASRRSSAANVTTRASRKRPTRR